MLVRTQVIGRYFADQIFKIGDRDFTGSRAFNPQILPGKFFACPDRRGCNNRGVREIDGRLFFRQNAFVAAPCPPNRPGARWLVPAILQGRSKSRCPAPAKPCRV